MQAWNSVPTGRDQTDAQVVPTPRSTAAQDARTAATELAAVLMETSSSVRTPLQAKAWEHAITELNLTHKYSTLANSIRHGFDVGIPSIKYTFAPPNKLNSPESIAAFHQTMRNEINMG